VSDASVPWFIAAYAVAFLLLGGYALRLVVAKRRRRSARPDARD
jgi:hypothetical protein